MSGEKIRELSCSNCGALLAGQVADAVVRCAYCGKGHSSIYPPPTKATEATFKKGDAVAVNWGERWWPARVTSIIDESQWIVQYDGWGPKFKEEVDASRIRPLTAAAEEIPGSITIEAVPTIRLPTAALVGGLALLTLGATLAGYLLWPSSESAIQNLSDDAIQSQAAAMGGIEQMPPNSSPVPSTDMLTPGKPVYILWEHAWFPGEIVSVKGNRVRVHYDGWDKAYDETMSTTRIRLKKK